MFEGLRWHDNGQAVLSGPLKKLYDALDLRLVQLSRECGESLRVAR